MVTCYIYRLYMKALRSYIYIFVCMYLLLMLATAGKTAGPNRLTFFEETHGYLRGKIDFKNSKFFSWFLLTVLMIQNYSGIWFLGFLDPYSRAKYWPKPLKKCLLLKYKYQLLTNWEKILISTSRFSIKKEEKKKETFFKDFFQFLKNL